MAVSLASPLGFGLGAPLLSKVTYGPAEVKTIQPEVTVQHPEYTYKSVPYPVPVPAPYAAPYAVPYAAHFAHYPFAAPVVVAAAKKD